MQASARLLPSQGSRQTLKHKNLRPTKQNQTAPATHKDRNDQDAGSRWPRQTPAEPARRRTSWARRPGRAGSMPATCPSSSPIPSSSSSSRRRRRAPRRPTPRCSTSRPPRSSAGATPAPSAPPRLHRPPPPPPPPPSLPTRPPSEAPARPGPAADTTIATRSRTS
ncbi:hypothetical protein PTTG_28337 [Puccinia triticina 1-1 BBBD Race 1]|uniref:Uncharacterized protein n=1 Tax=Puccinia triticina (isolate 1-1 / race 1 (BBBD)) TaxID=630390 RepID=A0A180GCK3_PUCT1|nr:hypothetical protein PTTG_28337 [Puccinia triticina 1-1 BBBD Race 1]